MKYNPEFLTHMDSAYGTVTNLILDNNLAAILTHKTLSVADLKNKYQTPEKKIRVLVVPGHEPSFGGAEYKDLKERDMNVELAYSLAYFLKKDGRYEVIMTRDKNNWHPLFAAYFKDSMPAIIDFYESSKNETQNLIATGKATKTIAPVMHNNAPKDVAYRLYGINKWSNENNIDIAIHVHFNDYPRKRASSPGIYSGFAIYVPEKQFSNSTTTRAVGDMIFKRLQKYSAPSNLPGEGGGFIEEPDLIAIGAYNTNNYASMLIEYGYIYEPQFNDSVVRNHTLSDLAFQTYLGLEDFFGSEKNVSYTYDTVLLPHVWKIRPTLSNVHAEEVLALQSALVLEGVYPPAGKNRNDCPRSGTMGPCTKEALQAFQKKHGIVGEEGRVGEKTHKILSEKYSGK